MGEPSVSVVIPTLDAESEIGNLLTVIESQTLEPTEVIVVDSSSSDGTAAEVSAHPRAELVTIARSDFNHGLTRDMAARRAVGEFVCFLTQDAVPVGDHYLEDLLAPMLSDPEVALVSGRQLPKPGARRFEQLVRRFNYPAEPSVRSSADLPRLGIKTFFVSDACSAYRREAYLFCGGFPRVETNEDMLMAARFVAAGLKVAYEPSAEVYHSHDLTPRQQFLRNKAVGSFLEEHAGEFMGVSELGEGGRLVKAVSVRLLREGRVGELLAFGADCAARLLGNRVGRAEARGCQRKGADCV